MIHQVSPRRNNKYHAVNCGGFTESLYNSQIQGLHHSGASDVGTSLGAFLSACGSAIDEKNAGYYVKPGPKAALHKGTISCKINNRSEKDPTPEQLAPLSGTVFLDEINSLPMGLQSSLLRIIQEKEVAVVGENKPRKYAAKVICATNKVLTGNENEDGFRRDLYHRLARGIIELPSLRNMADSIPMIVEQMLSNMGTDFHYEKIIIQKRAIKKLVDYHWPGNHRELENVLYRAVKKMMLDDKKIMECKYIKFDTEPKNISAKASVFKGKTYAEVEIMYVEHLLKETGGNKKKAADMAGFKSKSPIDRILKRKRESQK